MAFKYRRRAYRLGAEVHNHICEFTESDHDFLTGQSDLNKMIWLQNRVDNWNRLGAGQASYGTNNLVWNYSLVIEK